MRCDVTLHHTARMEHKQCLFAHGLEGQVECRVDATGVPERRLEDVAQVLVLHRAFRQHAPMHVHARTAMMSKEMYASVSRSLTEVGMSTEHTNDTACQP